MFDDKLVLRPKMRESYLIQRLQKPSNWKAGGKVIDNPFSFGGGLVNGGLSKDAMGLLRGILSFDYMGSSEFEWGAVPAALRFLAEQASAGTLVAGKEDEVFYVSPAAYETEVKSRIAALRENEYAWQKKEHCGLKDYFESKKEYARSTVGWLELDNGYAFFVDPKMFKQFCDLFGVKGEDGEVCDEPV